jgi:hypothetical protein
MLAWAIGFWIDIIKWNTGVGTFTGADLIQGSNLNSLSSRVRKREREILINCFFLMPPWTG